jgi:hypothetical protein
VSINAEGFRDRDHPIDKAPDTIRIAVLGDSYVDATTVGVEERFTNLLSRDLAETGVLGSRTVEVLNFGTSGYGTAQELQVLRHHVWKYSPDVVVLAFLPFNDIRNNHEPLEGDDGRPYFQLRDGKLVLDESFRTVEDRNTTWLGRLQYAAIDYSRLAQLMFRARVLWARRQRSQTFEAVAKLEAGLDAAAYRAPVDERWQEAWRVTEALITQMHDEVKARGARFLVVTLSAGPQVDPRLAVRQRLQESLGVEDLFYAERRLESLCMRQGMHCLPLGETFQSTATETGTYYHGFQNTEMGTGHWNANGHALASRLIARALVDFDLLRPAQ